MLQVMWKFLAAVLVTAGLLPALRAFETLAQTDTASVAVSAPSDPISAGKSFEAEISVANATNLGHFQFRLRYDARKLEVASVAKGPFLGSSGREASCFEVGGSGEVAKDSVGYACVTLGGLPAEGASGGGVLATVTFKAKSAATVPLELFDVVLTDPPGQPLPSSTTDASVVVVGSTGVDSWLWGLVAGGVILTVALVMAIVFRRRNRRRGSEA
jgi:hypothetical protein